MPPLRVMQVSRVRMNPYVGLLKEALVQMGVSCEVSDGLSPRLIHLWRGQVDVLHIHWLELLYTSPRLRRRLRLMGSVLSALLMARVERLGITCTMHNVSPHETSFAGMDRLAYRVLLKLAGAVHVHDEEAAQGLAEHFGRRSGVFVIPHGSYIGAYPNACTRKEAHERLGLDREGFVYLFLGQVRRYKGIEELIRAYREVDPKDAWLLIAGNVHDEGYANALRDLANRPGIRTWFEYVPDAEVQYYMNASDVCVLPYRDVTTSGAAVLAFSFGKPIVAPALGGFRRLAADGRGITYEPLAEGALSASLIEARAMDLAGASQAALSWAQAHEWRSLAPSFAELYASVSERGRPRG